MGHGRIRLLLAVGILLGSSLLLFGRLGHAALWDDEAAIALFAMGVWRTGDTSAVIDHNIVAYDFGYELKNLRNRYMPPLSFYVAAPFVGILGRTALAARLPFAICGLLTVAFILYWLWRDKADLQMWILMGMGLLGNVSFMLHARQCRYFALAALSSTILVYQVLHWNGRRRTLLAMAAVSLCLFAANYMSYMALYVGLFVDYLFWLRKTRPLTGRDWAILMAPQIVLGGALWSVYDMVLAEKVVNLQSPTWFEQFVRLPLWYLRELNSCEFGVGLLLVTAPLIGYVVGDPWLIRGSVGILSYVAAVVVIAPHLESERSAVATIRYLMPIIPLCVYVGVLTIRILTRRLPAMAIPLGLLAFCTNVLHGGPLTDLTRPSRFNEVRLREGFRSTLYDYVKELLHPPPSGYAATAEWINRHVGDQESIWVLPRYAIYPLMYHAPKATYAWQLEYPPAKGFEGLAPIHFKGQVPPRYVIVFGPNVEWVKGLLRQWEKRGLIYSHVTTIDHYYYDLTRPELFWHAFKPVRDFDRSTLAIYVFKRLPAARPSPAATGTSPLPSGLHQGSMP